MTSSILGITSIFGPPREPGTWSSAPASIAQGLERRGVRVVGIDISLSRFRYALFAGAHLLSRYGRFRYSEAIARGPSVRRFRARKLRHETARLGITRVLHTGTLDMPSSGEGDIAHYLLCDHTWHLSLRHRPDAANYTTRAIEEFDEQERQAYLESQHIFTFGEYVRQDIVSH